MHVPSRPHFGGINVCGWEEITPFFRITNFFSLFAYLVQLFSQSCNLLRGFWPRYWRQTGIATEVKSVIAPEVMQPLACRRAIAGSPKSHGVDLRQVRLVGTESTHVMQQVGPLLVAVEHVVL